jgi:hypothetical protein
MITFKEYLDEEIKGMKHAHSILAKNRQAKSDAAKTVHLHRLKKDGSESGMHDARTPFQSEEEARKHHDNMKKLNPGKQIEHHLYVDGKKKDKWS